MQQIDRFESGEMVEEGKTRLIHLLTESPKPFLILQIEIHKKSICWIIGQKSREQFKIKIRVYTQSDSERGEFFQTVYEGENVLWSSRRISPNRVRRRGCVVEEFLQTVYEGEERQMQTNELETMHYWAIRVGPLLTHGQTQVIQRNSL